MSNFLWSTGRPDRDPFRDAALCLTTHGILLLFCYYTVDDGLGRKGTLGTIANMSRVAQRYYFVRKMTLWDA